MWWRGDFGWGYPKPIIAKGETEGSCGSCQLTSEREMRDDTHVDWWVYDKSTPQIYFSEVIVDELIVEIVSYSERLMKLIVLISVKI